MALGATDSRGEPALEAQPLFRIERSKNANIVQYDAQVTPQGGLYVKEPVVAYWVRLAEDGRKAELTFFQRQWAYGFEARYDDRNDSALLNMRALKDRPITVKAVNGVFRALMRIGRKQALLERVYVTTREGGWLPNVLFFELYGKDADTGADCYEKITL